MGQCNELPGCTECEEFVNLSTNQKLLQVISYHCYSYYIVTICLLCAELTSVFVLSAVCLHQHVPLCIYGRMTAETPRRGVATANAGACRTSEIFGDRLSVPVDM